MLQSQCMLICAIFDLDVQPGLHRWASVDTPPYPSGVKQISQLVCFQGLTWGKGGS